MIPAEQLGLSLSQRGRNSSSVKTKAFEYNTFNVNYEDIKYQGNSSLKRD